jgi:hypothetical protein
LLKGITVNFEASPNLFLLASYQRFGMLRLKKHRYGVVTPSMQLLHKYALIEAKAPKI